MLLSGSSEMQLNPHLWPRAWQAAHLHATQPQQKQTPAQTARSGREHKIQRSKILKYYKLHRCTVPRKRKCLPSPPQKQNSNSKLTSKANKFHSILVMPRSPESLWSLLSGESHSSPCS